MSKRVLKGKVVSSKNNKTIVVEVERTAWTQNTQGVVSSS